MKNCLLATIACLLLAGCAATQTSEKIIDKQSIHSWVSQTEAIELIQAVSSDHTLYVKYRAFAADSDQSRLFYAKADWKRKRDMSGGLSENLSRPLVYLSQEEWEDEAQEAEKVFLLDDDVWENMRSKFLKHYVPKEEKSGIALRIDEEEIFVYYDDQKELKIAKMEEKPAEVRLKETFSPNQVSAIYLKFLESAVKEKGIKKRKVIFITLDNENVGMFTFFDLDSQISLSLSGPEESGDVYQERFMKKSLKSADQLILKSHVLGMVARPVSSTAKLVGWTKDSTMEAVNPDKFRKIDSRPLPPLNKGEGMDLAVWEKKLDKIVGNNTTEGTLDYLIGGDEFFPRLIDAFQSAQNKIYVRIFIFDNDDYALKIADILKKKSLDPDMDIKVLVDGMGTVLGEGKIPASMPAGFVPPASMIEYLKKDSNIKVRVRPNAWFKADHVKTIIIDDKICFTGGMNIGREYRYDWHDMMMEMRGPAVAETVKEFNVAWSHAGRLGDLAYLASVIKPNTPQASGFGYPLRLLYTRLNEPQILRAQLEAIREAKKYIYINNSYFSDSSILYEIIQARRRGVDVRVILPYNGNHEIMNKNNVIKANIMFEHGIKVYFYPGMSHIKAAVIDGWLCTGSANFDKLSFKDNLEMNVATSHPKAVEVILNRLFLPDFEKSMEMTEPLKSNLGDYVAKFFAEQLL